MSLNLSKVGVVIMAAGKGTRLNCTDKPKVMLEIGGRPIVSYAVSTIQSLGFAPEQICLVVGFKKEQVENYFQDKVSYALQEEQLGTAHAAYVGMKKLPSHIEQVLVMGGDDSAFYTTDTLLNFIEMHLQNDFTLSLLSVKVDDPSQLGRIVKTENGLEIIEKEYLTEEQKKINEISTGTFIFDRKWFEEIFPVMPKLRKLGEYGLPTALAIAREQNKKYQIVHLKNSEEWNSINTIAELELADKLKQK